MKAVALLMPESRREEAVRRLGELCVLHLRERPEPEPGEELQRVELAIRILEECQDAAESAAGPTLPAAEIVADVLSMAQEREALQTRHHELQTEMARIAPLGDFEPESLAELRERGLFLRVYRCREREFRRLAPTHAAAVIRRDTPEWWIAILSREAEVIPGLREVALPSQSPSKLRLEARKIEARLLEIHRRLRAFCPQLDVLHAEARRLRQQGELRAALATVRSNRPLAILEGYCPQPRLSELHRFAREQGGALLERRIHPDDQAPTHLANPPWIESAGPVYRIINSLPGYREMDVSLWFLIYLTLFFAILIGDAGYGLLTLLATLAWRRYGRPPAEAIRLLAILGGATVAWGALSGNWFGIEALGNAPVLRSLVIPRLDAFDPASQPAAMLICFVIGATHLCAAHLLIAWRQRHSLTALCQIGWTLIVAASFFVVRYLVLETPTPPLAYALLITGTLLAVFFAAPQRNLLRGAGIGVARLPLKLMNCFGDLISYIRLFAVGMATLAVAASFNEIAAGLGVGGPGRVLLAGLVLLLGHGINLAMAALGVIVHGVRLNMLEFSGHAELEWSGTEFQPFQLNHTDNLQDTH